MDMSTFVHSIGVHVYIMIIIFFSFFFSQKNFLQHRRTSVEISMVMIVHGASQLTPTIAWTTVMCQVVVTLIVNH